jgi:hypothetical protein
MLRDLILAAVVTILLGTMSFEAWSRWSFPGRDAVWLLGTVLAIAAGPWILWRRGRQPLIPVSAIYIVLMLIVLLFIAFNIAWMKGTVDL